MDDLTVRPNLLKQANLSFIRKLMKSKGTVTRAEIAWETKISSTTVRSLLTEMQRNGEVESIGYDESSGGRKAERYRFKMDKYYGVAFCVTENNIHCLIVNLCGEIVETSKLEVADGNYEEAILSYLDTLIVQKEIKSIGLGVPGIVEGGSYLRKNQKNEIVKVEIGNTLSVKYDVPVVMENDLNAITIGFGRCYEKSFPFEGSETINMAFLYFEKECISAGFIVGGKIIHGWNNYAGELGLIPKDEENSLSQYLSGPLDDEQFIQLIVKIITWICGILNPQYVALGGPAFRENCLGAIDDSLYSLLPDKMLAKILYSADVWHDYYEGMAFLTAGKMFHEIKLIKE